MIHDSQFDIQHNGTRHGEKGHYRVHPDVYHYIKRLEEVLLAVNLAKNELPTASGWRTVMGDKAFFTMKRALAALKGTA